MPATMEDSVIKIGTNTYKKRNVVAQLVEVGQFQELRLIYKSQVIYVCSDDPGSVNYQNSIFGQTEPQKILKASTGNIQVMGELSLALPESSNTNSSVKGTLVNISNTFAVGDILSKRNTDYIKSSLQNRNNWGVYLVVERTSDSFRIATEPGLYSVPSHGFGAPGDLLFHAQTGSTVTNTPPISSEWNHCIGRVFDVNTIEVVLPGTIMRLS